MTYRDFKIAGRNFRIEGACLVEAVLRMPGFDVFTEQSEIDSPLFNIVYADASDEPLKVNPQYDFEADGVESQFSSTSEGYHLLMRHDDGSRMAVWSVQNENKVFVSGNLMPQMLRFALWVAYGLMSVCAGRIPIHGSCIVKDGKAYIFLGESGTGKSTHTRLWRENIEGCRLLNDDSPIISAEEDGVYIYGSPWSGKTPCYHQKRFPLGACVRLSQAPFNRIERLPLLKAYAALHPSCPPEFAYDEKLYAGISDTLDKILSTVGIYHLECLPDADAARLSYKTLSGNDK